MYWIKKKHEKHKLYKIRNNQKPTEATKNNYQPTPQQF